MLGDALKGPEPDNDDWRRFRLIEAENSRLRAALNGIIQSLELSHPVAEIARKALEQ